MRADIEYDKQKRLPLGLFKLFVTDFKLYISDRMESFY